MAYDVLGDFGDLVRTLRTLSHFPKQAARGRESDQRFAGDIIRFCGRQAAQAGSKRGSVMPKHAFRCRHPSFSAQQAAQAGILKINYRVPEHPNRIWLQTSSKSGPKPKVATFGFRAILQTSRMECELDLPRRHPVHILVVGPVRIPISKAFCS